MFRKPKYLVRRWSFLLCLRLANPLFAQPDDIRFDHLSVEQGLSNFSISDIIQDRQGFLWIATEDGLNKYDGYEFKVFKADPADSNALPSSFINHLYLDRSDNLWVTAGGRLCRYDPVTGAFERLERVYPSAKSFSGVTVTRVIEDRHGEFWIGTSEGLFRYDRQREVLRHYRHVPGDSTSLSADHITTLGEDREGVLWFGTLDGGLYRFDRERNNFTHCRYHPDAAVSLSNDFMWCILEDRRGIIWIGMENGLCRYDRRTDRIVRYRATPDEQNTIGTDRVFTLFEDSRGTLWAGSRNVGLWRYEPVTGRFLQYQHDPSNPFSLRANRIHAIYEDRSGVLWFGHYRAGLSRYARRQDRFARHKINGSVYAICQDRQANLWIGCQNLGLQQFDRSGKLVAHYRHDPKNPYSLSSDDILAIREDRQGRLWICTANGVNLYDPTHRRFVRYPHVPTDPASQEQYEVKSIYEDAEGEMWFGTKGSGLLRWDREKQTFIYYRNLFSVWSITADANRDLWMGGDSLYRFDRRMQTFTTYPRDQKLRQRLIGFVYSVYADSSGYVWMGTFGGGLNRYDPRTDELIAYTEREGSPDNFVKGILPDGRGNLWLSTDKGLSRFDPRSQRFKNFTVTDGLIDNVLLSGAYFKSADGRMYFGGEGGVIAFHPDSLSDNPYLAPVVITSFKIFDKSLPRSVPQQSHLRTNEPPAFIRLSYRYNFFSFEFVALDFTDPGKNQYAYKLEGFDPDWVSSGKRRYANYTNVDPGEYTFRVKGSNSDGVWNEAGVSVNIIIMPPFWKTWWFRTSVILSVILALHTWHHRRTRALEEKKKALELQVQERTAFAEALQHALTEVETLKNRLEAENTYLQDEIKVEHNFADIISRSEALKKVLRKVEQVAATDATVLILGGSGTGKELLARAVHNLSARRERPLVKVNCAVLPATLIESELFGHEKGAFTGAMSRKIGRFELADHGTIFLDEIGELPLELQAKLLRILQGGEFERLGGQQTLKVDTRVIAATNRDLQDEIARNRFREDLYYRLNVFPVTLPPLRERKEDIPLLVNHFMKKYSAKIGKKIETVSQHVIETLQAYDWPGNVRELENVVERAVIVSQGKQLKLDDWLPHTNAKPDKAAILTLEDMERHHILKVLEQTGWRISGARGAAKILNVNASTLRSRMEKLGIKK